MAGTPNTTTKPTPTSGGDLRRIVSGAALIVFTLPLAFEQWSYEPLNCVFLGSTVFYVCFT